MRDELKSMKAKKYECGIVNLDSSRNEGSHWCCYFKDNDKEIFRQFWNSTPTRNC